MEKLKEKCDEYFSKASDVIDEGLNHVINNKIEEPNISNEELDILVRECKFPKDEKILFLWRYNYSSDIKSNIVICITQNRIIKYDSTNGKNNTNIVFNDIDNITYTQNGAFKWDKINFTFHNKKQDTIAIYSSDVGKQIYDIIHDILNNRDGIDVSISKV